MLSLLAGVQARPLGASDVDVTGVAYRSSAVEPGHVFVCVPGFSHDGHSYAADAVARGAAALIVQRPLPELAVPQFQVEDARSALAIVSDAYHDHPSRSLKVVGITGTNGKTTSVYLVDSILRQAGLKTGFVGTVETRIGDERQPAGRTTPESADISALLAKMRDEGVAAVTMEVSSHAIDLHRADAIRFACVAFTNLTQDHLDYHHTLEEYYSVKKRLFTHFDVGARVSNVDDPLGRDLAHTVADTLKIGRAEEADVRAIDEDCDSAGTTFTMITPKGDRRLRIPLPGAYNVSNALLAAGCALQLGIDLEHIGAGLESAPQVPGRLERVDCGQDFTVFVDYAHTPDSLEKAAQAVRAVTSGRTVVVFGCGGDRDPEKRALMGRAAGENADLTIVTSDNPRSEDPVGIILQIEDGLRGTGARYEVEVDRRSAIARAFACAGRGDSVLIAGKGHEDYQIFADRTIHFDDREVAREVLGPC
ncbi:MAG: UDP-N-acetylmuramoyl-L-alanyl-D-glutamate--2,6-diaminopimelate ligase [Coriobacteriales bacterium]|nr:UDP-N-acetylmuramoyl-L-alanyl-D-glutamate--2,6-diaminopimelate ligase [Coriobacteriales bacterium]